MFNGRTAISNELVLSLAVLLAAYFARKSRILLSINVASRIWRPAAAFCKECHTPPTMLRRELDQHTANGLRLPFRRSALTTIFYTSPAWEHHILALSSTSSATLTRNAGGPPQQQLKTACTQGIHRPDQVLDQPRFTTSSDAAPIPRNHYIGSPTSQRKPLQ